MSYSAGAAMMASSQPGANYSSELANKQDANNLAAAKSSGGSPASPGQGYDSPLARLNEIHGINIPEPKIILIPAVTPVDRSCDGPTASAGCYVVTYFIETDYSKKTSNTELFKASNLQGPVVRSIEGKLTLDEKEKNEPKKGVRKDEDLESKVAKDPRKVKDPKESLLKEGLNYELTYDDPKKGIREKSLEVFLGIIEYDPVSKDTLSGISAYDPFRHAEKKKEGLYKSTNQEDIRPDKYNPLKELTDALYSPERSSAQYKDKDRKDGQYANREGSGYMGRMIRQYSGRTDARNPDTTVTYMRPNTNYLMPINLTYMTPFPSARYSIPKDKLIETIARYGKLGLKLVA